MHKKKASINIFLKRIMAKISFVNPKKQKKLRMFEAFS